MNKYELRSNTAIMRFIFDLRTWFLGLRKIFAFTIILLAGLFIENAGGLTPTMSTFLITIFGMYSGFNTLSKTVSKTVDKAANKIIKKENDDVNTEK